MNAILTSLIVWFGFCFKGQLVFIVEKPQDVNCFEGESATFVCRVSPADLPHVQWCLDHTPLQPSSLNDIHVLEGGFHSLTVRELMPRDSGTISVVAGDQKVYASLVVKGN